MKISCNHILQLGALKAILVRKKQAVRRPCIGLGNLDFYILWKIYTSSRKQMADKLMMKTATSCRSKINKCSISDMAPTQIILTAQHRAVGKTKCPHKIRLQRLLSFTESVEFFYVNSALLTALHYHLKAPSADGQSDQGNHITQEPIDHQNQLVT